MKAYSDKAFWDAQPLGQMPDDDLAVKLGYSRARVHQARQERGIPPHGRHQTIDWSKIPLGTATDAELARRLGILPSRVYRARKKRGIPAYDGPRKQGLPDPAELRRMHWDDEMSTHEMAAKLGRDRCSLVRWMRRRGIPIRSPHEGVRTPRARARISEGARRRYAERRASS